MSHCVQCTAPTALYEQHRIRLEQERNELEQAIGVVDDELEELCQIEADEVARAKSMADQELLLEQSSRYRQRLKGVRQSLERIRDGAFGLCINCGHWIGEKRLRAIPSARYCLACQERSEQKQAIRAFPRKCGT